jgi:hypothetical protein
MKLEVGATPPVGRHRRLANGSSSAGIAPVALTQPTPNSEEPDFIGKREMEGARKQLAEKRAGKGGAPSSKKSS